jgi:excisionase family DNA binding protein
MTGTDHEAAIRTATEQLVSALLAAVRADAVARQDLPERLLSIDEAADAIGIGRTALYGAIGAGKVRSIKVGRRRLVPSSVVAELAQPR